MIFPRLPALCNTKWDTGADAGVQQLWTGLASNRNWELQSLQKGSSHQHWAPSSENFAAPCLTPHNTKRWPLHPAYAFVSATTSDGSRNISPEMRCSASRGAAGAPPTLLPRCGALNQECLWATYTLNKIIIIITLDIFMASLRWVSQSGPWTLLVN